MGVRPGHLICKVVVSLARPNDTSHRVRMLQLWNRISGMKGTAVGIVVNIHQVRRLRL